mmetsp:Transcript_138402/g.442277  ORF Transcript_138402/g.442277 Transcript_138402/m.442277 type:complete len:353 (+) Transcript_138402:1881-2939(+)
MPSPRECRHGRWRRHFLRSLSPHFTRCKRSTNGRSTCCWHRGDGNLDISHLVVLTAPLRSEPEGRWRQHRKEGPRSGTARRGGQREPGRRGEGAAGQQGVGEGAAVRARQAASTACGPSRSEAPPTREVHPVRARFRKHQPVGRAGFEALWAAAATGTCHRRPLGLQPHRLLAGHAAPGPGGGGEGAEVAEEAERVVRVFALLLGDAHHTFGRTRSTTCVGRLLRFFQNLLALGPGDEGGLSLPQVIEHALLPLLCRLPPLRPPRLVVVLRRRPECLGRGVGLHRLAAIASASFRAAGCQGRGQRRQEPRPGVALRDAQVLGVLSQPLAKTPGQTAGHAVLGCSAEPLHDVH